jgi:hypothetical protein
MDYPGKVITKTQVTPTQTSASGNWTLDDQAAAIKNNNWPVALVPNPISKSLRFNSADSAYLNRTPASTTNRQVWTYSAWVKRASVAASKVLLGALGSSRVTYIWFNASNNLGIYSATASGGGDGGEYVSSAIYRDPSAWYHVVVAYDSTQATSTNRIKAYVNGSQITAWATATAPTLNHETQYNWTGAPMQLGAYNTGSFFDGYITEQNFIDGQALTPSSFGMTNPQTGQWIPLKYSGTYGTNGFYLNFKDATSTTTLGYDYSGNANNWTTNNFSVTAGAGNDSLTDVPTPWFAYNTTGDVGGVIRGNYCTLNPNDNGNSNILLTNGNLSVSSSTTWDRGVKATFGIASGKWYYEYTHGTVNAGTNPAADIGWTKYASLVNSAANGGASSADSYFCQGSNGNKYNAGSGSAYGSAFTTGDVEMCALDLDNGKIYWGKNGTWFASGDPAAGTNAAYTGLSGTFFPLWYWGISAGTGGVLISNINFGQRPFAYTPPTGFRSLCTTNLPATAIGFGLTNQGDDYFAPVLYTGTGSTQTVSTGFDTNFTWIKNRNSTNSHLLADIVRGNNKVLLSNDTAAEITDSNYTAFVSGGFSVSGNGNEINNSGAPYISWNWKAGGTGVSNTAGTITSTVSANTTAGFSIVTYTGNNTTGATIGHGLGVAPSMIIIKDRLQGTGYNWNVYHASIGNTQRVFLDATSAAIAGVWNNTSPTSTVFTLTNNVAVNGTDNYVAYCFAAVPGYSAFGSYTGNGSTDGPFVYLGFRPRYILFKQTNTTQDWIVVDTARSPYNEASQWLYPNLSYFEESGAGRYWDALSNGFKIRNSGTGLNTNGGTYIYAAFAESPFQFSNAR